MAEAALVGLPRLGGTIEADPLLCVLREGLANAEPRDRGRGGTVSDRGDGI
jgi:hypothetical protein